MLNMKEFIACEDKIICSKYERIIYDWNLVDDSTFSSCRIATQAECADLR